MTQRGSYQGQDRFVIDVLGGKTGGFFLDSGASNGVRGSNSLVLEQQYGWRGICVEPNRAFYGELVRNRSAACVNCCLWSDDCEVEFLEAAGPFGGIVAEYDAVMLSYAREEARCRSDCIDPPAITRPARTIRSILRDHAAPSLIDYWSLDTEGSELTLLQAFPFDEYVVSVITVEHNFTTARRPIAEFLRSRGYRLARELGIDDGFVFVGDATERCWRNRALLRSAVR